MIGHSNEECRLVVLTPTGDAIPMSSFGAFGFGNRELSYRDLLANMQRFRGRVYESDGAIRASQLTADGRHESEADRVAWHMLLIQGTNSVSGCARYVSHPPHVTFNDLGVSECPLSQSRRWGATFRHAVQEEIAASRRQRIALVEVGGWALAEELRCTRHALGIALATYSLAHCLGDCLGLSTVTVRHGSSSILRRIGGDGLKVDGMDIPAYFDPSYDCDMEVLRFDSRVLNPRFQGMAEDLNKRMVRMIGRPRDMQQPLSRPLLEPVTA